MIARFPYRMILEWQLRKDGLWVADCPCGACLCGCEEHMRIAHEALHFANSGVSELDEERNRYNDKHALAFAPDNKAWLARWWELSARNWEAHRTAPSYYEATGTSVEVLPLQDQMRKELFRGLK